MKEFSPNRAFSISPFFFSSFCRILFLSSFLPFSSATLFFRTQSFSISFGDAPATFAVPVNSSGICGALHWADPLDACSPLQNSGRLTGEAAQVRFALIERGNCPFDKKVRYAQAAGFQAAVIFNNQYKRTVISMIGDSQGIRVHAVFISKRAGEILKKLARGEKGECCISPLSKARAWTVLVISIFSLVIIVSVFAMLIFVRNHRIHLQRIPHHSPSINSWMVKCLPSFTFNTAKNSSNHNSATCVICIEDYRDGERLRVLPCQHEFHATCVDAWLTKWGTFCPVCKFDMRTVRIPILCC